MMASVACTECGHPMSLAGFSQSPDAREPDEMGLFEEETGYAIQAQRSAREKVAIACGSCGIRLRVPRRLIGRVIACPSCKAEVTVPRPREEETDLAMRENSPLLDGLDFAPQASPEGVPAEIDRSRPRRLRQKTLSGAWMWGGIAGGVLLAIVVLAVLFGRGGRDDVADSSPANGDDDVDVVSSAKALVDSPVDTPVIGVPTQRAPTPRTRPAGEEPTGPVLPTEMARWRLFAGGGRYPARPGRLFLVLTIAPPMDEAALAVEIDGTSYPSLGAPASGGAVPRPAVAPRPEPNRPSTQRVFEVPARGGVALAPALPDGRTRVRLPDPPASQSIQPGLYIEQAPRNLRPLLRGPVLEAVQSAPPGQGLRLEPRGKQFRLELPAAGVSGLLRRVRPGVLEGVLRKGPHSRVVTLRSCRQTADLADGIVRVVLYLDDQPMHQLTFRRTAAVGS
jgi:hypothetical protein